MSMNTTPKKIESVEFGLMSPQEYREMSVTKIITADTYDDDGFPIDMGLMDPRLGVIDPGLQCKTCGKRSGQCEGHFGHIELAAPVVHPGFSKLIRRLLRGTCHDCARLLLTPTQKEKYKNNLETAVALEEDLDKITKAAIREARKNSVCPHCDAEQKDVKHDKPTTYYEDGQKLMPSDIRDRFERIPDEDLEPLGIHPERARPEWMILTVLPVPPVTARPSITLDSGQRSEDDLTHKLVDIIRINQRFMENREAGSPQLIIEDLWELLQYHVTTFVDNEISGTPPAHHRSGRPLKTLSQRLKGKEGRFRGSLSGKRVNYSSRTVISPDPTLSVNEIGVPESIAKEMTQKVKVTRNNIDEIVEYVRRGPEKHPGANYVKRADGRRLKVKEMNSEELAERILEENEDGEPQGLGWTVERHLTGGDIVLFNRQPSLHRMSMMAHEVVVMPYKTFRLNTTVCVAGDTEVECDGYVRRIENVNEDWEEETLTTYDPDDRELRKTGLRNFVSTDPDEYGATVHRVETEFGSVVATSDHPLETTEGPVRVENLEAGDTLLRRPCELPEFEPDEEEQVVVTENEVREAAPRATYLGHTLRELDHLLPFDAHSRDAVVAARLVGHLFGDGTLDLNGRTGRLFFRASEEDLEEIRKDLERLGFEPERPVRKEVGGQIVAADGGTKTATGAIWSMKIGSKPLATFMAALGVPAGDKVTSEHTVPDWISEAPKAVKRAFLSAYFGADLSTPSYRGKKLFRQPVFKLSRTDETLGAGKEFVRQMDDLLDEFGSGVSNVRVRPGNRRADGSVSKKIAAELEAGQEAVRSLFGRVGYTYNADADAEARLAYAYLTEKADSRLNAEEFPEYDDWKQERVADGDEGLVEDTVISVDAAENQRVYDVTTVDEVHKFFTNQILGNNCPPYNADFDGDEMNMHVVQSEEALAEADVLMKVQEHILSPRFGGPIIGAIQDHISGTYLLTHDDNHFDEATVLDLLRQTSINDLPEPAGEEDGDAYWTGDEVFSVLLPDGLDLTFESSSGDGVVIEDGELVEGTIDEMAVGSFVGEIVETVAKVYGEDRARQFIDDVAGLAVRSIMHFGFSFGISDEDLPQEARDEIEIAIEESEQEVERLIETYDRGELESLPGRTLEETLEMKVMQALGKARDEAGEIAEQYLDEDNPGVVMADSGARGSMLNLTQMAGCVGQQAVRGERINRGYENRTLSHFEEDDLSADARGFVRHSYKEGLDPKEFFFHAMGGREGLVDTAVRTSKSGYLQRRLINALQELEAQYDGTVRNAEDDIVQFEYGEDGVDPMKMPKEGTVDVDSIVDRVLDAEFDDEGAKAEFAGDD